MSSNKLLRSHIDHCRDHRDHCGDHRDHCGDHRDHCGNQRDLCGDHFRKFWFKSYERSLRRSLIKLLTLKMISCRDHFLPY